MSDSRPNINLKPKTHPLISGLSDYLKDPANFEEIMLKIAKTLYSTCGHSEVLDWANCDKCTKKMLERRKLLKSLGFRNPAQFMAWRAVHEKIKERYPLVDFKSGRQINH